MHFCVDGITPRKRRNSDANPDLSPTLDITTITYGPLQPACVRPGRYSLSLLYVPSQVLEKSVLKPRLPRPRITWLTDMLLGVSILIVIFGLNGRWNVKARMNGEQMLTQEAVGRYSGDRLLGLNHH